MVKLAPREVQQTHKLLNTGWALATVDNKTSGLVPINYVQRLAPKSQPVTVPETTKIPTDDIASMQPIDQETINVEQNFAKSIDKTEDNVLVDQINVDFSAGQQIDNCVIETKTNETNVTKHDGQEL